MDKPIDQDTVEGFLLYVAKLREAFTASEETDSFDLRSDDPESVREFKELVHKEAAAHMELVLLIRNSPTVPLWIGYWAGKTISSLGEKKP